MTISGQVAIVTGAGQGLGRSIALRLAREGVRVAVCGRREHLIREVEAEIRAAGGDAFAATADVARNEEVESFVRDVRGRLGAVDILINNAGLGWYKPFLESSIEEIDATIDVNLKGTIYLTRAVLPEMVDRGRGQIVNVASDLGRRILPNMATYVAAKHGVVSFASSLLREVKGRGVKVMTLTPGIIDTYFGGGEAGTRDPSWSLKPGFVADLVVTMLNLPEHIVFDEISFHAMRQDF